MGSLSPKSSEARDFSHEWFTSKKRKKTCADFLLEQEDKSIDRAIGTLRALAQKKRQEAVEAASK